MPIGDKIAKARFLAEMTQEDLAWAVGKNRTTITNIESGTQNPTVKTLKDIAYVLGVSVDWLLDC